MWVLGYINWGFYHLMIHSVSVYLGLNCSYMYLFGYRLGLVFTYICVPQLFRLRQTYQVSRIRRETHALGVCLTLSSTATIFSRIRARPGKKLVMHNLQIAQSFSELSTGAGIQTLGKFQDCARFLLSEKIQPTIWQFRSAQNVNCAHVCLDL